MSGGSTRPEELFTVFTGIILTAEIERARKGSAVALSGPLLPGANPLTTALEAPTSHSELMMVTGQVFRY